jgi:Xaa-Pro aminopeptidase
VRAAAVSIIKGSLLSAVGDRLQKAAATRPYGLRTGFEPARISVQQLMQLRGTAGAKVRCMRTSALVEGMRAVKDAAEVGLIRDAAVLASKAFEGVLPLIKPGIRESELAAEIEYRMRRLGASGPSFETIVAFGARSALPHARPSARRLRKNELVVLDLGAILRDYCSDLTRTVFVGRAPARIRGWYQAVLEAQAAARAALRPGATSGQVDQAAREVLRRHRLDRFFAHSTGHGLGLEVHEDPRLAAGQKQKLQSFNVVTLEPGVYVQGVGGIRIEDDLVVAPGEARILTTARREFLEL